MQKKLSAIFAAVVLGATSLAAVAQPQGPRPDGGPQGGPGRPPQVQQVQPQDHHRQPPAPQMQSGRPGPVAGPGAHAAPRPPAAHHAQQRHGAGPDHRWTKGSRVPPQYRSQHYVVKDWQHHGLKRPARGQQWVQNGNDYLLVAVASGVIAQIVFGH